MTKAIVLITTDVGKEDEIMEKLYQLDEVKEVFLVYGVQDIIAIVETDTMEKLRNLITEKIRRFDGVKTTHTSIVVTHKSKKVCMETPPEAEVKAEEEAEAAKEKEGEGGAEEKPEKTEKTEA